MSSNLEVLKDIPGYKAILKSVLKSQIQLLIEQLSQQTGEETVILTACVHDGSLSHLGSTTGKGFLEGREEIKSQFLGYCLNTVNKRKNPDIRASPYQRPFLRNYSTQKHKNVQPVVCHRSGSDGSPLGNVVELTEMPSSQNIGSEAAEFSVNKTNDSFINQSVVKYEDDEQSRHKYGSPNGSKVNDSFPSGIHLSHTQTSVSEYSEASQSDNHKENDSTGRESETDDSNAASIKTEPVTENDMDLEITGVEPGNSIHSVSWSQSQRNQDVDQSGYNPENQVYLRNTQFFTWKQPFCLPYSSATANLIPLVSEHNPQDLTKKLAIDSMPTLDPFNNGSVGSRIACKCCGRYWKSQSLLERHMRLQAREKPYSCGVCGKLFKQKSHVVKHLRIHLK